MCFLQQYFKTKWSPINVFALIYHPWTSETNHIQNHFLSVHTSNVKAPICQVNEKKICMVFSYSIVFFTQSANFGSLNWDKTHQTKANLSLTVWNVT